MVTITAVDAETIRLLRKKSRKVAVLQHEAEMLEAGRATATAARLRV